MNVNYHLALVWMSGKSFREKGLTRVERRGQRRRSLRKNPETRSKT
jgi:hypothetical protein